MEPKKRGKLIGSHEYLLGCAILICNSSMKQNWQQKRSLLNLYLWIYWPQIIFPYTSINNSFLFVYLERT